MLFNSLDFAVFFPLVYVAYFLLPSGYRPVLLLIASCYFYMAFIPAYILILVALILVDFFMGIFIEKAVGVRRKIFLVLSIVANIGFLAVFKYLTFFVDNLNGLASFLHWNYSLPLLSFVLPIGLSFHCFQSMAYTIEVYRGHQRAERNLVIYALYVMFFPQLVAGPIERPGNLLPQLKVAQKFNLDDFQEGLRRILWGLFLKLVIADRVAVLVDQVYADPSQYNGIPLLIGAYFFAIQIYCDFAGYSHMAIGLARMMGIKLMENFCRPYFADSVSDFWRRWHISLSTWFRDYVYFSLGGNRTSSARWCFNVLVVFALSGFWHGAQWTFVVWGLLNAFYILWERLPPIKWLSERIRQSVVLHWLKVVVTFHLTVAAWVFFRSDSFAKVQSFFVNLGHGLIDQVVHIRVLHWEGKMLGDYYMGIDFFDFCVAIAAIALLIGVEAVKELDCERRRFTGRFDRYAGYAFIMLLILLFGVDTSNQFVYFQF